MNNHQQKVTAGTSRAKWANRDQNGRFLPNSFDPQTALEMILGGKDALDRAEEAMRENLAYVWGETKSDAEFAEDEYNFFTRYYKPE
jgi:hypothetical protein